MKNGNELSWTRKLAFSFTAFLLCLALLGAVVAVGEMAVRSVAPKSDDVKLGVRLEHSERRYGLRPNVRSIKTGVLVGTNSLGFREKEYPVERLPGVPRIAVLGDSYTFGVGVEFSEIFSKQLEAELNRSREAYEVINFGVIGYNTVMELATFREAAAQFRPDLVIVAYVLNDTERWGASGQAQVGGNNIQSLVNAGHLWLKERSMLYSYLSPKIGAVFGLFNARYAVGQANQTVRSFDEGSLGWIESRQAILDIANEARMRGARTLVIIFPMMLDFATYPFGPAHDKIAQFCKDHEIEVLDLLPRFRHEKVSDLVVFLDGHPNSRAHRIFADEIYHYLSRRYASSASRP
jgi:lysophospholipase L1-like esterase